MGLFETNYKKQTDLGAMIPKGIESHMQNFWYSKFELKQQKAI